jgi:hypothetical protein
VIPLPGVAVKAFIASISDWILLIRFCMICRFAKTTQRMIRTSTEKTPIQFAVRRDIAANPAELSTVFFFD